MLFRSLLLTGAPVSATVPTVGEKKQRCRCQSDRLSETNAVSQLDNQKTCPGRVSPLGFFSCRKLVMSEARLFVGNLAYQTMENDLQEYFSTAGVVSSVNLMLDKFTGKSRGFAFVEYSSSEEANKAVEMFHNKEFQGRALTVNIARPKEDRPPRSGGGGGGGYRDRGERHERH